MIDASRFAPPNVSAGDGKMFRFGTMQPKDVAEEVRRIAGLIEDGTLLLQKVQSGQTVSSDDFTMHGLFFEFAERE